MNNQMWSEPIKNSVTRNHYLRREDFCNLREATQIRSPTTKRQRKQRERYGGSRKATKQAVGAIVVLFYLWLCGVASAPILRLPDSSGVMPRSDAFCCYNFTQPESDT
ncbi:hypothetical protein BHE74_00010670 [Ensete ventricosum]|nr:hypothetical protein BHE74_00010670 [Ensete ventricosum]